MSDQRKLLRYIAAFIVLFAQFAIAGNARADTNVNLFTADLATIQEANTHCWTKTPLFGSSNTNYVFKGCSLGTTSAGRPAIIGRSEWDSEYWGHVYAESVSQWNTGCPTPLIWSDASHACEDPGLIPEKNLGSPTCTVGTPSTACGNPIEIGIGNKFQIEIDVPARGLLGFNRYYNSLDIAPAHLLGPRWTNTYTRRIEDLGSSAKVTRPDGKMLSFSLVGGVWEAGADIHAKLERLTDGLGVLIGWTYQERDAREIEFYDQLGRLISITNAAGQSVTLVYNNGVTSNDARDFLPSSITAQDGRRLQLGYDTSNRLTNLTDSSGGIFIYSYDGGRLSSVKYPDDLTRTYVYNEPAYVSGGNRPLALTGIIDEANARYATFSYQGDGKALSTEHAGGVEKYTANYASNALLSLTLPSGQIQQRSLVLRNGIKRISSISEPGLDGTLTRDFVYDSAGLTDSVTDAGGVVADYDFNARGLLTQVVDDANNIDAVRRTTQTDWHPDFAVPTERRVYDSSAAMPGVLKSRAAFTYNTRGQVTASCDIDPAISGAMAYGCGSLANAPAGVRQTRTTYCEEADVAAGTCPLVGLVVSVDGPRTDVSDVTQYLYYASDDAACVSAPTSCPHRKGDLWKVIDAAAHAVEVFRYDGAGRALSSKDANGVITDYEYSPRGMLTATKVRGSNSLVETDDAITRIDYWPTGLVKKVTQPDGAYTSYTYDDAHRLTDISDSFGNTIHFSLDAAGNRTGEDTKDPSGVLLRTMSRVYNLLGQLETAKDAYQHATGMTYDAVGNTDTVTDALNHVTDNDYDPLRRLSKTIQDLGGVNATTEFKYDARDNLTKVIDPKGLSTDYGYDGLGDLKTLTSPDTGVTTYTYDSAGNRKTQVDARNVTVTYGYDVLNRLVSITYPTSSLNVSYVYDTVNATCATDEAFAVGHLTRMTDGSGSTDYCYDRFGNLVRKVQVTNGKTFVLRYGYTLAGNLAWMAYPGGGRIDYVRNAQGQISGATAVAGTEPPAVLLSAVTYYPFGPASQLEYGDGRRLVRTLNQNYQPGIVQDVGPGGLSLGYEFDAVGNLLKLRNGNQNDPPLRIFGNDALNRLTEVRDGSSTLLRGYGYDATGNRTSATVGAATTTYSYPTTSHRLSTVGSTARTYDAAGNTTNIGGSLQGKTYVFDDTNRMTQVKTGTKLLMNYAYNGKGEQVRRFATQTSTGQTYTVYDEAGHIVGIYDSNGGRIQEIFWLDDLPVGLIDNNQLHYIEADHLGTPRAIIDPVREVAVWKWDLTGEVFGKDAPNQDPDADGTQFVFDLRFPGQRYDATTGFNYNYFRDYEPSTGRYAESDPLNLAVDISTYGYSESRPTIAYDSLGLASETVEDRFPMPWDPKRCAELLAQIAAKRKKIGELFADLDRNWQNLPNASGGALRNDRMGHVTLINILDSQARKLERDYDLHCKNGGNCPAPAINILPAETSDNTQLRMTPGAVAAGIGAFLLLLVGALTGAGA